MALHLQCEDGVVTPILPALSVLPVQGAAQGNLVGVFQAMCGIFPKYADEATPDVMASSNVRVIPIHKTNRHSDVVA